ncbi:hypothetical protein NMG60_11031294 [Bertholletia excelsa]
MDQNESEVKEHNHMGLSDCSSVDSSTISTASEDSNARMNLRATELRLGLPGSQSPERSQELCLLSSANLDEKPLFPLHPSKDNKYSLSQKTVVSGNKRGFSEAVDGFSEGKLTTNSEVRATLSSMLSPNLSVKSGTANGYSGTQLVKMKEIVDQHAFQEKPCAANENSPSLAGASNTNKNNSAPVTKSQVVGWPPIRSFRKNALASTSKNTDEVEVKAGGGTMLVKVSMDGAPYLRKVDLRVYSAYQELSSALEKMFSCFTIGPYGSHGAPVREMLSESKLKDLQHGSEYVLTYEDKDGDWMLVGDVPWEMFIETCKRVRIMKSSDAIGLAPRAVEKCPNRKS